MVPPVSGAKSLYVHFPFCESKCHYCDFYSLGRERTRTGDDTKFEAALLRECELAAAAGLLAPELETIFFGGGTPSMTPPESMVRALAPLWERTRVTPATEWTMEANPSSISLEGMKGYRALGVNRVSMGVQALRPDLLTALGRVHSREAVFEALEIVQKAGFENFSVDLLCGVPNQGLGDIERALEELTKYPITHLSCYLLTLPPHHKMYPTLPNEDEQLAHLLFIDQWMRAHGFDHYEISNYCRPGREARHNLNYWKGASYLGLGPSAHSYDSATQSRWKNVSSLHKYGQILAAPDATEQSTREWTEKLTPEQLGLERWMLALRLSEGFPADWLDTPARQARARVLAERGFLEPHPAAPLRLRLTPKGLALSDQVIAQLA